VAAEVSTVARLAVRARRSGARIVSTTNPLAVSSGGPPTGENLISPGTTSMENGVSIVDGRKGCMMCRVVNLMNLTPHPITVCGITIPPSGIVARVTETVTPVGALEYEGVHIPLVTRTLGPVTDLPEPQPDTIYIVSSMVASAAWAMGRRDVAAPGDLVRDEAGRVIGAASLIVAPDY
jgi:hypothetical protein